MTCIVGLVDKGTVYIGGDSAGVADYSLMVRADQKVFTNGEFIFGFTSSFRMGQVLRYKLKPPHREPARDVMTYMVSDFVDAVRDCLKSSGFAKKENDVERGGTFLVGYQGRLFRIEGDYQVGETTNGYDACGCGEDIARGSMFASKGADAGKRILQALKAAGYHSAGVCGPFKVLATPATKRETKK